MANPPQTTEQLLARHATYLPTHKPIAHFPADISAVKRMLIISCIDPRVIPEQIFGLEVNEVPVLRNVGGRARTAVWDVAVLDTLVDVAEVVVLHHTNCGATLNTDAHIASTLGARSERELAKYDVEGICFAADGIAASVRDDVAFLRQHPFVRKETRVVGFVYDIWTGGLERVDG
ncbi:carbonic anhydrase [Massariosphaeria phaeospora]|uniref:Carbonic anhydrase n=1 Tax=Massariosphaeria phaeospora TaxID=100035 RepID=A0A7C8ID56_9PLEO|nr:carbonic anhydrase [Massariosphaeria phaeospora]